MYFKFLKQGCDWKQAFVNQYLNWIVFIFLNPQNKNVFDLSKIICDFHPSIFAETPSLGVGGLAGVDPLVVHVQGLREEVDRGLGVGCNSGVF